MLSNESCPTIIGVDFPHIAEKLIQFYGHQEFNDYIEFELLFHTPTKRRPKRSGFPLRAIMELNEMLRIHCDRFPHLTSHLQAGDKDPWGGTGLK